MNLKDLLLSQVPGFLGVHTYKNLDKIREKGMNEALLRGENERYEIYQKRENRHKMSFLWASFVPELWIILPCVFYSSSDYFKIFESTQMFFGGNFAEGSQKLMETSIITKFGIGFYSFAKLATYIFTDSMLNMMDKSQKLGKNYVPSNNNLDSKLS